MDTRTTFTPLERASATIRITCHSLADGMEDWHTGEFTRLEVWALFKPAIILLEGIRGDVPLPLCDPLAGILGVLRGIDDQWLNAHQSEAERMSRALSILLEQVQEAWVAAGMATGTVESGPVRLGESER